ncbi:MAG TPA: hypothetical protein VGY13_10565 [Solirubrobacteraceae bacterium]|jgi:hypothetical protein|nr:hypothetical protein [Solirubrobacteraceae bacterium]
MSVSLEPATGRSPAASARLRGAGSFAAVAAGALLLRAIGGVGFANYDTLYALAWGGQLSRGVAPAYDVPIAPTPHPLLELLGVALAPLPAHAIEQTTVAIGFLALAGCGWVVYRLGAEWFGRIAGAIAALVFLTRVPVLSYGVRAYIDLPYLLLVLGALLAESRHRRTRGGPAGAPVLALLALAGLLRPEAWAFSGLYWLYLLGFTPSWLRSSVRDRALRPREPPEAGLRTGGGLARLTLLAGAAPLVWLGSDLLVTGDPLWSLTHTQHDASTLRRATGIADVPEYIPRRIGEILRPPELAGAAVGGVLSLLWLRSRALPGALAGVLAVLVFALFASIGLPIDTRYAFLAAAILCIFCGAGVSGWMLLSREDPRRRWWMAAGALTLLALIAFAPSQYRAAHRELDVLAHQHSIEGDLVALVESHAINLRCGPVGVPNHAPVPLLALYLKTSPRNVVSLQSGHLRSGVYVDPASKEVEVDYVLAAHDPVEPVSVPPGFTEAATNRSWLIFKRCE